MFRYENVGESIKHLARTIAIITLILYLLVAVFMFFSSFPQSRYDEFNFGMFIGSLIVAALGVCSSWLSGLLLFGFGELIDNTTELRDHFLCVKQSAHATAKKDIQQAVVEEVVADPWESGIWICRNCHTENPNVRNYCLKCKSTKEWSEGKQ